MFVISCLSLSLTVFSFYKSHFSPKSKQKNIFLNKCYKLLIKTNIFFKMFVIACLWIIDIVLHFNRSQFTLKSKHKIFFAQKIMPMIFDICN